MKRRTNSKSIFETPAGPRLRCFLGRASCVLALCLGAFALVQAQEQLEPRGPMHLWRIHGYFVNEYGKGIANVPVTLQRDGRVFYRTKTDVDGQFEFDHVSGQYLLHIDKANYSELSRQVIVGEELAMRLRRSTLYVIAGPRQCTDDCSSVFTSQSKFDQAINRDKQRHSHE